MTACLPYLVMLLLATAYSDRSGAMCTLASTGWGYDHQTLLATYIVTWRSKVEYGSSSCLLWILNSTLENPERSRYYAGFCHWPASYYTCQSHPCRSLPPLYRDKGNQAVYGRHGEITEDSTNTFTTVEDPVVFVSR